MSDDAPETFDKAIRFPDMEVALCRRHLLELEELLGRREALREAWGEYEAVDKAVKAAVKGRTDLLVGDFLVTGKEITRKAYVVKEGSYWRSEIERLTPKGDPV